MSWCEPTLLATLAVGRAEVTCVESGGGWLVAGFGDGSLRAWRWRRGGGWTAAGTARAHRYGVTAARFAPAARLLASAGVDGAARLWALDSDGPVERVPLAAPGAAAARAACWAGGARLAVGHDDGAVRLWAAAGALLACVRPHQGAVHALAFFGRCALLLTGCTEGVLKIFNIEEVVVAGVEGVVGPSARVWRDGVHDMGVSCACAADDGDSGEVASGGQDGRIILWTAGGEQEGGVLSGHSGAVAALRWRRALLVSAALDRTVRLWAPRARACLRVLPAHRRYLTALALDTRLRYMLTGSNDKTIRMWSLGAFSIDDEVEPECNPVCHYGIGDLEGIGPVDDEVEVIDNENKKEGECSGEQRVWHEEYNVAINCIAAHGELFATACSDGCVRVYGWRGGAAAAVWPLRRWRAHGYPALTAHFGAGGGALLTAGLDCFATLWDVQSGCELVTVCVERVGSEAEAVGCGVRDARLSRGHPARMLLACDDGSAAVWDLGPPSPAPLYVYGGAGEAATCCAWAGAGRVLVAADAGGALRLFAPPRPAPLDCCTDAHDLGVLSCDFAQISDENIDEDCQYLLATGGHDALVKIWEVEVKAGGEAGSLHAALSLMAHEGSVQAVRWGAARLLATGGTDRWARVWRIKEVEGGNVEALPVAAVGVEGAGGAAALALLAGPLLVVGSLAGELALWTLPGSVCPADTATTLQDDIEPRFWAAQGVCRWIREYITRPPGVSVTDEEELLLLEKVEAERLTGARLLDDTLEDIISIFGYGGDEDGKEKDEICKRLENEILWLRREPLSYEMEAAWPHALRCPLSHAPLREPVRAADGFTYERAALAEARAAAADEMISPMTGRRLRSGLVEPNYKILERLRTQCEWKQ